METAPFQFTCSTTPLCLPPNFILPEDKRPHISQVSTLNSIPIIDLNDQIHASENGDFPSLLVEKISRACEEYGFFQIINHGVPQELCNKMMTVSTHFFELPFEQKKQFFTTDFTKQVKLFNYYLNTHGQEKVNTWSQSFSHPGHPIEDLSHLLPENPPQYREVFGEYAKEIGALMNRLLSLISQSLGLEKECLQKRLGENPSLKLQANYYPPCPEPELTLGLGSHTDVDALTILCQSEGVSGLQVIKNGKWVAVDPVPNAFVINLGDQIQVLSNGRYKSVQHRAVTNKVKRISLAMFYGPSMDAVIGPIQELVDEAHPPVYRNYRFSELREEFDRQRGTRRMVKEVFELPKK
ncbi:protein DMR6-LIKE OXYGENASE 1-like [Pistacia vera]|uniref:protein DMR6-LIKE OXYGENASE 1-like n=1 Tax=Pistacia vera TaxID=55513 RepID=UPI0012631FC2|nr:protein DMR6-LIKE OXYGENASE 1-like [Pistacia vera]